MRASAIAERAGVRSVSIVAEGFVDQAKAVALSLGMPDLAIAVYPDVIMTDDAEQLRVNSLSLGEQIAAGLDREYSEVEVKREPYEPTEEVFSGSLDDVQQFFRDQLWTDGLPIIPPTAERVELFLNLTRNKPHEAIATLAPEYRQATAWNIAVNGVMAGCRPEYMPVLIALVKAIADPAFHLENAGSTAGLEPVIIVSGPIVRTLQFNFGAGLTRPGVQANTTISRFLRLAMRNIAGFRTHPGTNDMATFGLAPIPAIAEDVNVASEIGWPSYGEDRGFSPESSIVTVMSTAGVTQAGAAAGPSAETYLQCIVNEIGESLWAKLAWCGIGWPSLHPLLLMSPSVAQAIARGGWSKDTLRRRLAESIFVKASAMEQAAWADGASDFSLARFVREGRLPSTFAKSDDPDRLVPAIWNPAGIQIVVCGDPHRNRVMGYIQAGGHGEPISREIES